jgi:NodT family efflux transporter outer membrane factor (OMF) lipoprotein
VPRIEGTPLPPPTLAPRIRRRLASLLALLATGCTVGPDFKAPGAWSPLAWFADQPAPAAPVSPPALSEPVAEPIDPRWWSAFNDAELSALEDRVAAANLDVRAATLRLAESRAQRRIAAADQFPKLNGDASYQRELPSSKGIFSLLGSSPSGGATGVAANGLSLQPFNVWQYGFDASWELDLWGRVRRSVEVADATVAASEEARRDTLLSMLAEVARNYVELRGAQTQLRISRENVETAAASLKLTRERAANGLTSTLDVNNAAAQLDTTAAAIPQLEQQQMQLINQLGFLLGEAPRALADELATPHPVPPVPPRVPIGVPSELARRRPDIRQAEAQLHAQTAQIGVAVASFYPSVSLNGSIDLQALHFGNLANWGARTYSVGPNLTIPIFEGGRLTGNLELAKAQQQAAAVAYQRTVLNAWQEVDNALTAYAAEQRRLERLQQAVAQNRQALGLARQQYTQGLTGFLQVLTAEQQLLLTEQQAADSTTTVSLDLVALYKALGGGWEASFPRAAADTTR